MLRLRILEARNFGHRFLDVRKILQVVILIGRLGEVLIGPICAN
jgi:hypothetical protein